MREIINYFFESKDPAKFWNDIGFSACLSEDKEKICCEAFTLFAVYLREHDMFEHVLANIGFGIIRRCIVDMKTNIHPNPLVAKIVSLADEMDVYIKEVSAKGGEILDDPEAKCMFEFYPRVLRELEF